MSYGIPKSFSALALACVCIEITQGPSQAHDFRGQLPVQEILVPPAFSQNMTAREAGALGAIVNAFKLWRAGATLTACFMGGVQEVRQFFVETEHEWERYGNLTWDFGSAPSYRNCDIRHPSHIRIVFENAGNWSFVGTDAIRKEVLSQPSINIGEAAGGATSLANRDTLRGIMLHEQGHADGWEHEHQNPSNPCIKHIKWAVVYKEMSQPPNGWDKAKVDQNLRALVTTERLRFTDYDPKSIMHYSFPASWFDNPSCAVSPNLELSETDRALMRQAYPRNPQDQRIFLVHVNSRTKIAADKLDLSREDQDALQKAVQGIDADLADGLKDASLNQNILSAGGNTVSVGPYGQASGVNFGTMNQTNGNCAFIASQNTGSTTITANCPR